MSHALPRHRHHDRTRLAAALERRRLDQGWTLPALAAKTGYHFNTVARVLHGENVGLQTFLDVAQTLGADLEIEPLTTTECVDQLNRTA